jgi:hypothetical protein
LAIFDIGVFVKIVCGWFCIWKNFLYTSSYIKKICMKYSKWTGRRCWM